MDGNPLPLIVVEVLLVFGGAVAFAWWQFRDLARERAKREAARRAQAASDAAAGEGRDAA
jgi:hypothetical protein